MNGSHDIRKAIFFALDLILFAAATGPSFSIPAGIPQSAQTAKLSI